MRHETLTPAGSRALQDSEHRRLFHDGALFRLEDAWGNAAPAPYHELLFDLRLPPDAPAGAVAPELAVTKLLIDRDGVVSCDTLMVKEGSGEAQTLRRALHFARRRTGRRWCSGPRAVTETRVPRVQARASRPGQAVP